MEFERLGRSGLKITLESDEAAAVYRRLAKAPALESKLLIAAILEAARESCGISFSSGTFGVEIIDSSKGAVIYVTPVTPYYYLSKRRFRYIGKAKKQLFCYFKSPGSLLGFISTAANTALGRLGVSLLSDGNDYILAFSAKPDSFSLSLLSELETDYSLFEEHLPESCEEIISCRDLSTLKEILDDISRRTYPQN